MWDLVPRPGTKPGPPSWERTLSHWVAREGKGSPHAGRPLFICQIWGSEHFMLTMLLNFSHFWLTVKFLLYTEQDHQRWMSSLSLQTAGWDSNVDNLMRHSSKPPNATKWLSSKESARPSLVREALSSLKWAEKRERGFKKGETNFQTTTSPHNLETAVWQDRNGGKVGGRREAATGRPRAKRGQLAGATGLGERRAGAAVTREVRRGQARGGKQLTAGVASTHHGPVVLHPGASSRPCTRLLLSKERIPQGPGLVLVARAGRCSWHLGGRSQRCC